MENTRYEAEVSRHILTPADRLAASCSMRWCQRTGDQVLPATQPPQASPPASKQLLGTCSHSPPTPIQCHSPLRTAFRTPPLPPAHRQPASAASSY